jgi:hypothetical protein
MYKAIMDRVAGIVDKDRHDIDMYFDVPPEEMTLPSPNDRAYEILSIRGDIVDGKWVDKPDGRFGIAVVDRKAKPPDNKFYREMHDPNEPVTGYHSVYRESQQDMLKAGFVKEVSRDGEGL